MNQKKILIILPIPYLKNIVIMVAHANSWFYLDIILTRNICMNENYIF